MIFPAEVWPGVRGPWLEGGGALTPGEVLLVVRPPRIFKGTVNIFQQNNEVTVNLKQVYFYLSQPTRFLNYLRRVSVMLSDPPASMQRCQCLIHNGILSTFIRSIMWKNVFFLACKVLDSDNFYMFSCSRNIFTQLKLMSF